MPDIEAEGITWDLTTIVATAGPGWAADSVHGQVVIPGPGLWQLDWWLNISVVPTDFRLQLDDANGATILARWLATSTSTFWRDQLLVKVMGTPAGTSAQVRLMAIRLAAAGETSSTLRAKFIAR